MGCRYNPVAATELVFGGIPPHLRVEAVIECEPGGSGDPDCGMCRGRGDGQLAFLLLALLCLFLTLVKLLHYVMYGKGIF